METIQTRQRELTFPAKDGYPLAATVYEANPYEAGSDHVVILGSATAVPRQFYRRFATFLAERGMTVLTFDYRGIGGSAPKQIKGFGAQMRDWGRFDLAGAIAWAREHLSPARLGYAAHSVGGQIMGLAEGNEHFDRIALVSSQSGDVRLYSTQHLFLQTFWRLGVPLLDKTLGYVPMKALKMGENLPGGIASEWARWARTPGYLMQDPSLDTRQYAEVTAPIRAYHITDDAWAPRPAIEQLLTFYSNAEDQQIVTVDPDQTGGAPIKHFGMFRERLADTLWQDVATWLRA